MAAFWIAVAIGAVTAIAYVALAVRSFLRIRQQVLGGIGDDLGDDRTFEEQGEGFSWKATGGVIASILVIAALSLGGGWWYLVPFLAICSAVAVIAAFVIDRGGAGR